MAVPRNCSTVIVNDSPYSRMSSSAFFRAYYSPIRASALNEFHVSAIKQCTFPTENITFPSPNIKFGSIVADHKLLTGNLADKGFDQMKAILGSAFVMDIPELYINRSLKLQLNKYFERYPVKVDSQSANFLAEHNLYHTSSPDIIFWNEDTQSSVSGPVVNAREYAEGDDNDQIEDDEDRSDECDQEGSTGCGELKKGTGGKYQLYGESFNVAVSYVINYEAESHSKKS